MLNAVILQVYEARFRPSTHRVQKWLDHQQGKVGRALDFAEYSLAGSRLGPPHIGEIALAAALGYLGLRFGVQWRAGHSKLVTWLADFSRGTPAFAETRPQG